MRIRIGKILILFCLIHLLFLSHAERLHQNGMILGQMLNLPHRSLGLLYAAHIAFPDRHDFCKDYLLAWAILDHDEWLLEGQTRPVMPQAAVVAARNFPRSQQLRTLRNMMMMKNEKKNVKASNP